MGDLVYTQHALSPIGSGLTDHALPYLIEETQVYKIIGQSVLVKVLGVSTHSQLYLKSFVAGRTREIVGILGFT